MHELGKFTRLPRLTQLGILVRHRMFKGSLYIHDFNATTRHRYLFKTQMIGLDTSDTVALYSR
jgi:hypothetical protein